MISIRIMNDYQTNPGVYQFYLGVHQSIDFLPFRHRNFTSQTILINLKYLNYEFKKFTIACSCFIQHHFIR
jgi:hypothetical protein